MAVPTKILVVDDEPDLASLVRQKFRRHIRDGMYAFEMAGDGVEALECLERNPDIVIVLTDINMPRMDGLTLLSRIAKQDRLLQAIVVSAYGDLDNIRMAMNRGSFDFLMKPIDLQDLEITINKAIETIEQQRIAAEVRKAFGRYLSDEVVATLLSKPDALKLGGEKRKVTILMSDLRGFSNISENLAPEQVVDILNIYLGKMAGVITEHRGTIDEFIGDAILVVFGAPLQRDDDAVRAVACALEMQLAMESVNAALREKRLPELEMGIGINTGEVVVGNIGSSQRTKYGVVGSNVNLTARIESYTVGGQILVSESTRAAVGSEMIIGRQMKLSAKGFSEPIHIYEVEGLRGTYTLRLPVQRDKLTRLDRPLDVRFNILDGKHMTGVLHAGAIVSLSPSAALLHTEIPLEQLANIRVEFPTSLENDTLDPGDLYAKAIETDSQAGAVKVRFTAVPEEVAAVIRSLCSPAGAP